MSKTRKEFEIDGEEIKGSKAKILFDRVDETDHWYNLWNGDRYMMSVHKQKNEIGVHRDLIFKIEISEERKKEIEAGVREAKE